MESFRLEGGRVVPCPRAEAEIRLYSPQSEADRLEMFQALDFRKHDLESALDPDENSRVAFEEGLTVVIVKRPKRAMAVERSIRFEVESMGLFLEPGRLTVVSGDARLDLGARTLPPDATLADVALRLLGVTVTHFSQHLRAIKLITADIQSKINVSMENRYLLQMFALVESLVYYANSIESNEAALARLHAAADRLGFDGARKEYLANILLDNQQCVKQATIYSSVLSGLMDARGNIINNNMNMLLKKLTLLNVVFLPLNLLAGLGGMSEYTRMTAGVSGWVSYPLFLAGIAGLGVLLWKYLLPYLERPPKPDLEG